MNDKLSSLIPKQITVTPDVPPEYEGLKVTIKLPKISEAKELIEDFKAIGLTTSPEYLEFFKSRVVSITAWGETFVDDFWDDGYIRSAAQDAVITNLIAVSTINCK